MFDPEPEAPPKPDGDGWVEMRVLITVKAAPTPSAKYGETVCVAGLRLDLGKEGWVRLYPINFRALDGDDQFHKYEVVQLSAKPARDDRRKESWRPDLTSVRREHQLPPGRRRKNYIEPHIRHSMCTLLNDVRKDPPSRSLAVIRPREVLGLDIGKHPGWSEDQLQKMQRAADSPDLFGSEAKMLAAPRFSAWYRYLCEASGCRGHRQGVLDWELVALQHRLRGHGDDELQQVIRTKFLDEKVKRDREIGFYVGNQAKREHTFSVLGVHTAPR
jgi:hypothetical protein